MSVKVAIRAAGLALVLVAGQAIASEPDFEREARLAESQAAVASALRGSKSYRVTAPLRFVAGLFTEKVRSDV